MTTFAREPNDAAIILELAEKKAKKRRKKENFFRSLARQRP